MAKLGKWDNERRCFWGGKTSDIAVRYKLGPLGAEISEQGDNFIDTFHHWQVLA